MDVVPEEDHARAFALRTHDVREEREQAPAALGGIERWRGVCRVAHSKKVERVRQGLGRRIAQKHERARDLLACILLRVGLADREDPAQQLSDGDKGECARVRRAVRPVHVEIALQAVHQELDAEPALAEARGSDHSEHTAPAFERLGQHLVQALHLGLAPHEARKAAGLRVLEPRPGAPHSCELEHRHRLDVAFDLEPTEGVQIEEAPYQAGGRLGQVAALGRGELLDALRQTYRVTLRGVVHPQVVADLSDDHLAGIEAHAHGEVEAPRATQLVGVRTQLVAQPERRVAGALRVVFVRNGRTEQRHDPIAGVLVDRSLEAVHAICEDLKEVVQDRVPLLRVDLGCQLHRALDVRKEHCHLFSLALEGGASAQDLLRQVLWSVRAGIALRSQVGCGLSLARPPTGTAELILRISNGAATCAGPGERRAAGHAEAYPVAVLDRAARTVHLGPSPVDHSTPKWSARRRSVRAVAPSRAASRCGCSRGASDRRLPRSGAPNLALRFRPGGDCRPDR